LTTPSGRSRATQRARRARSTTATTRSTSFCRQTAPPRTAAKKRVTGAELRRRLAADGIVVRCELDSSSERGLFTEAVRTFRELVDGTGVHGPPLGREVDAAAGALRPAVRRLARRAHLPRRGAASRDRARPPRRRPPRDDRGPSRRSPRRRGRPGPGRPAIDLPGGVVIEIAAEVAADEDQRTVRQRRDDRSDVLGVAADREREYAEVAVQTPLQERDLDLEA
jgi:hypothetical protein